MALDEAIGDGPVVGGPIPPATQAARRPAEGTPSRSVSLYDAEARALYADEVDVSRRGSVSALFRLVPDAVDVLDVGIGGGSLGQRLATERGCRVDGVTVSADEAARSAPFYRRIEVADLGVARLDTLFSGERYKVIVCADVLEHLARPTQVLDACRNLLTDDGVLLLSIPNVGYVGLLGELLTGEFRYRLEGLLDRTHLRFFTRRSLLRMLREAGWQVDHFETVRLELPDSEFRVSFDSLPPAMRRYLLAMPDGLSYQFIVRARPAAATGEVAALPLPLAVGEGPGVVDAPCFSALLYLKGGDGYSEARKLVALGRIGESRQCVHFTLPPADQPLEGLRFDPADRPGFLHLFGLRVLTLAGDPIWVWDGKTDSLEKSAHQQVVFRSPFFAQSGTVLLLTGEDPYFELPLQAEHLFACRGGAMVEVELAWPMSADYTLFVDELARGQARMDALHTELSRLSESRHAVEERATALAAEVEHLRQLAAAHDALARQRDAVAAERDALAAELGTLAAQRQALADERDARLVDIDRLRGEMKSVRANGEALRRELAAAKDAAGQQSSMAAALSLRLEDAQRRLRVVESSPLFKVGGRFLPRLRQAVTGGAQATDSSTGPTAATHASSDLSAEVDVIVPVYKGLDETRLCLQSVLDSSPSTPYRLLVVNDASPQPEVTAYLRELRQREARVELIENSVNLGFVASVNRAMEFSRDRDVVLLNSDAEVAGDWLDRLRRPALEDARVSTVTPFSNSATICSYPKFCVDNGLPGELTTEALDRLFASANAGRTLEIPTAVGFCMFIRRSCLKSVGLFDAKRFGRGYGEENDFCMRARASGWRHVMALDVFVHHTGGVSFGDEKEPRVREAQEILARLHPQYPVLIHKHLTEDPAQPARLAVDIARLRSGGLPSVLCVLHNTGGGTERHVRELATALRGQANFLTLRPAQGGETILEWLLPEESFRLGFRLPDEYETLVIVLRALAVGLVHYHHLLGHSPSVWGLPKSLGVPHDFTTHDFYAICPQISLTDHNNRYCGEKGIEQCNGCLQRSPPPGSVSIQTWRAGYRPLIEGARHVYSPSADAASRLRRYFPAANIISVSHLDMTEPPRVPAPMPIADGRSLRIVVIGALSPIKGADILEAAAIEAARRRLPLEFHLLGFAYRSLQKQPRARLTVHGQYDESELEDLIDWLKPDLAWFPALWPETYSYTLSACLKAGLPIIGPDFGAFPERLRGRPWTWVCPWDRPANEWADFFEQVRIGHFVTGVQPEPASGLVAVASDFAYGRDYLDGIVAPVPGPMPTHEFLERHRAGRSAATVARHSKRMLLGLAVRMRNNALLRGLVRRVPLRWQTRVKVWLST